MSRDSVLAGLNLIGGGAVADDLHIGEVTGPLLKGGAVQSVGL